MASLRQFTIPGNADTLGSAGSTHFPLVQGLAFASVAAMICLSITTPIIAITDNLWGKFEQLFLPVVFVVYAWMALTGFARLIRFNGMFIVGAVQCSCILFSLLYGGAILHHSILMRDFLEIPKALLPVAYFTVAYEAELSERSLRRLMGYFGLAVLLVCLYAWAQWIGLGFTYTLNAIYSRGVHDDALFGARRVYATFGNANVLGQLLTWTFAAFTLAVISRVGNRFWNAGLALASVVTLAMTGSRYGLLDAGLCVILLLALTASELHGHAKRVAVVLALVPIIALTIWIVAASNTHTFERYQEFTSNPYQTRSFQGRLSVLWPDAEEAFLQSPFFGHGPAKSIFTDIVTDSEYLIILKEFGLSGLLSYLLYFLFPLALLWRELKPGVSGGIWLEQELPANFLVLRLSFMMVITGLVMNVGMSTYFNMLLQGFFWLWLGLGARAARTIREASLSRQRVAPGQVFPPQGISSAQ
jgi:hypothetical protein